MAFEVTMPQMGADMTEGTIVKWFKQVGENVARGELLAEIETDKANVEIEAFEARNAPPGRFVPAQSAGTASHPSTFNTWMKASCGISTLPNCRMRFLPSFCLSRSLRLRVASPP